MRVTFILIRIAAGGKGGCCAVGYCRCNLSYSFASAVTRYKDTLFAFGDTAFICINIAPIVELHIILEGLIHRLLTYGYENTVKDKVCLFLGFGVFDCDTLENISAVD
jgi:hypothetical protein